MPNTYYVVDEQGGLKTDAVETEGQADNDYQPAANNNPMHQTDSQKENLTQPLWEIINYQNACWIVDFLPELFKGTEWQNSTWDKYTRNNEKAHW